MGPAELASLERRLAPECLSLNLNHRELQKMRTRD